MSDRKNKEIAKWPDELPAPTEMQMLPPEHVIYHEQLISEKDICDLIHDLFFFPEDKYFLYFVSENKIIPAGFSMANLEKEGLLLRKYENYFYRRPWSETEPDKYSYIRLQQGEHKFPWQKELAEKGPMYCRVNIELMEWRKKQIELSRITQAQPKSEPDPIILKPSFLGFGVDLKELYLWIKKKITKKKV